MQALDIELVPGNNIALIDLFDLRVLESFGRAYGMLPQDGSDLSDSECRFLDEAVTALAEVGTVVCVRLALFAEMVKGKPWTPATLKNSGGAEGVGVTFLEETFSSRAANPRHRLHQQAAQRVLKALLPEAGSNIKGAMRSTEDLRASSGYEARSKDFDDLLHILDAELRLITPTDPAGALDDDGTNTVEASTAGKFYQLTHDYLVPALREWLTRKQRETRRGRAELRLAERSALWNAKPENRHLPSLWEYLNIGLLTNRRNWSQRHTEMMCRAAKVHGVRVAVAMTLLIVFGLSGWSIRRAVLDDITETNVRNQRERTTTLVAALMNSRGTVVPFAIADLNEVPREMVLEELRQQFSQCEESRELQLAYGLAHFGEEDVDFLVSRLPTALSTECANIVTALRPKQADAIKGLKESFEDAEEPAARARLATVLLHLGDASAAQAMLALAPGSHPADGVHSWA